MNHLRNSGSIFYKQKIIFENWMLWILEIRILRLEHVNNERFYDDWLGGKLWESEKNESMDRLMRILNSFQLDGSFHLSPTIIKKAWIPNCYMI